MQRAWKGQGPDEAVGKMTSGSIFRSGQPVGWTRYYNTACPFQIMVMTLFCFPTKRNTGSPVPWSHWAAQVLAR